MAAWSVYERIHFSIPYFFLYFLYRVGPWAIIESVISRQRRSLPKYTQGD